MPYINKVTIMGNVGRDVELRYTQSGDPIASFSVATSSGYKNKATGEWVDKTEWHNVCIMNKNLAQVAAEKAMKGECVYIEGALETRDYSDKSGVQRKSTQIVVGAYSGTFMHIPTVKKPTAAVQQHSVDKGNAYVSHDIMDSEIPF